MGFILISLYFALTSLVGSLCIKVCYNKNPSTNM
jgi:V-type H+-transporting ATPase subunit e